MKIENFRDIYDSLDMFAVKRTEIVSKCNQIAKDLAETIPEKWDGKSGDKWMKKYQSAYCGINEIIAEYSEFLDLFISFSHFLYRNRPVRPIIKAECWSILNLYELFISIECSQRSYEIKYSQIASLVQFIRLAGRHKDKKKLREYLIKNKISEFN